MCKREVFIQKEANVNSALHEPEEWEHIPVHHGATDGVVAEQLTSSMMQPLLVIYITSSCYNTDQTTTMSVNLLKNKKQ